MFGVFGMLALAVVMVCLRAAKSDLSWARAGKYIRTGFWGVNIGLAFMVLLDLFPAGVLQFWDSISHGCRHARRLSFLLSGAFHTLEWLRIVADMTFLLAGALPLFLAVMRLVLAREGERP
jgi:nitric oxide reductase subunit B